VQHHDWLPTFLAMAGAPDVVDKLKNGYKAIGRTYKNHIDGYNFVPYLTGKAKEGPRNFFFFNIQRTTGTCWALRYQNWKIHFMEQRCRGTLQVWAEPFTRLRVPKLFNLRTDPYEFADITSITYYDWFLYKRVLHVRGAGGGWQVCRDLQGLPAGAESPTRSRSTTRWPRCANPPAGIENRRAPTPAALAQLPIQAGEHRRDDRATPVSQEAAMNVEQATLRKLVREDLMETLIRSC
jgi:hypothetical protein